jgi:hypothetical protein
LKRNWKEKLKHHGIPCVTYTVDYLTYTVDYLGMDCKVGEIILYTQKEVVI